MNYKIGLIALVALQAYVVSALRPCVCARNLRPVCGSNGVTYSNNCRLECEKYRVYPDLTKAYSGPCNGSYFPNVVVVPCVCTDNLDEVCGSDGKTYANDCLLNCATANDSTLSIAHSGPCLTVNVGSPNIPSCSCSRNGSPVCGSNGQTYANDCLLNCATAGDSTLSISHYGECGNVNIVDNNNSNLSVQLPACTCPRSGGQVCGSNGETYGNDCLLNCATANDSSLRILHYGACDGTRNA